MTDRVVLFHRFSACGYSLSPLAREPDCVQEQLAKSWAGVYVDSAANEVLYLEANGGAFVSPGSAARDTCWDGLRWREEEGVLHLVDCHGRPLTWPGVNRNVWRESTHAGKFVGFDAEAITNEDEIPGNAQTHLVRDPFGFVFPDCVYLLSVRQRPPRKTVHEVRVVINRDGSVTEAEGGGKIGSWSFAGAEPLPCRGDESWATGDAVVLLIDNFYRQVNA